MKKFTWYIRGELLCLVVGKSEEWWLAGQDVKQLTPRQLHFPIYGVSDKWWDGLAIMLHHTYPDEQLLNICYWFYFATDDHGRPNQRAESGPDGRKIGRRQKATTWAALQSVGFYLIWPHWQIKTKQADNRLYNVVLKKVIFFNLFVSQADTLCPM